MSPRDEPGGGSGELRVERIKDPRGLHEVARKGGKGGEGVLGMMPPNAPAQATIAPNTLRSKSTVRILEVLSEGVVAGLHSPDTIWKAVFLDGTPVADEAGNFQFSLSEGSFRYGYPAQDAIPGYPISEAEFTVGVPVNFGTAVVRSVNAPMSAIRYKIRVPALFIQERDGDIVPTSFGYAFDYRIDGGFWINAVTERVSGKTMSPYERAVRVELPFTTGTIEIRMLALDPPSDPSIGITNAFGWSSYTEITDGQLAYDDTCVVSMAVDAQQFPTVPGRAYLLDGIMVEIPTNYNGQTHGYAGDWDGTFYTQWTNNPAWILYALLTNERWGLGRLIDPSRVDKWSFYEAAVYNDGSVPDGKGGSEVRFTCNCVINTRQDAYTVLQAVASTMNALLYYAGGTIMLAQDRLQHDPTRIFGPADVENGLFDYAGADVRSRFTAAAVSWNDPSDRYNVAVELVQDTDLVSRQGYKETQATAFACTSRGQAIRYGRWLIYTSQHETEMVTLRVGLENADVRPGERIAISDPSRAGARLAGRTVADTVDTITLDKVPDEMLANPTAWQILLAMGSAAEGQTPVINYVTVSAILPDNVVQVGGKTLPVAPGTMWLAHAGAVEPTPWRVASVADRGAGLYEILATEYHEEKFGYVDFGWTIPPPSFSLTPSGAIVGPTNIQIGEFIYLDGTGFPQFGVVVSWEASSDARVTHYQLEMSGPGADYRRFSNVNGISQDVLNMRQGEWTITLRALDSIGRRSAPLIFKFIPVGLSAKPLQPSALYLAPQGALTTVTWVPTGELDVVFWWVKWAPQTDGSATWERATTSIARVAVNTTQISTPTRAGTFMVKAIDSLGQESVGWAEAILLQQRTENIFVLDDEEQPLWAGDRGANWHRNLNELWLPPPAVAEAVPDGIFPGDRGVTLNQTPTRVATYDFAAPLDLGIVSTVSMIGIVDGYGTFMGVVMAMWSPLATQIPLAMGAHNSMSVWVPLAAAVPMSMGSSDQWDAHIECRVSQDGATFAPWFPLKSTLISGRVFEWRMIGAVYDLLTTLRAVRAAVIVDIPLRNIQGSDAALDGTGHLDVVYPIPFLATPTVQLTARQSLAPGGNIVITASDRNHFTVEHRDAAGAPHAGGSIDYFVQGYGGHA